ncbi:MAG: hypothetical protein HC906_10690 [Bacteroidales bacterium]|nr:hypothetical protein [Bacteroidales bacterium]
MKKSIKFYILCLFSVVFSGLNGWSQDQVYNLDLQSSIDIALEKSFDMKILRADLAESKYNLQTAVRRFRTHLDLDITLPDYSESIGELRDSTGLSYFPVKQFKYSSNLNLWQALPTDGRVYVSSGFTNTDDLRVGEEEKLFRLNTRIGIQQPLEALYSYSEIRSSLKRAR